MVHWRNQELCPKTQSRARGGYINSSGFCGSFALLQLCQLKWEFLISDLLAISCKEPPHCIARAVAMETIIFLVGPFSWKSPVSNERCRSLAAPVGQVRAPQVAVMRQWGLNDSSTPTGAAPRGAQCPSLGSSPCCSCPPEHLFPANGSSCAIQGETS